MASCDHMIKCHTTLWEGAATVPSLILIGLMEVEIQRF